MMMTKLLVRRSLILFAACAFALGATVMAQDRTPEDKPEDVERPAAGEPSPEGGPPENGKSGPAAEPSTDKKPREKPASDEDATGAEPAVPEEKEAPEEKAAPERKEPEPAGKDEKAEEAIDKESVKAVVEMSKRLAKLKSFAVNAEMNWEQVLENGEKIMAVEQVQADVRPPHGLRMERFSPGRERILFYNGKEAVLWGPLTRYYTKLSFDGRIADLAKHLADKYAYELPLADLFLWGREESDIEAIKAANYLGQDRIGERVCDHYAFRQENVDWQIWIDTAEGGLPCRYAIIDLTDPARPVFEATVEIEPDVEFFDKRFTFDAPKDAVEIPIAEAGKKAAEKLKKQAREKAEEKPGEEPAENAGEEADGKAGEKPDGDESEKQQE